MIAERYPELALLDPQEQLVLAAELATRAARGGGIPELTSRAIQILEERLDDFIANPDGGVSWEHLKTRERASGI